MATAAAIGFGVERHSRPRRGSGRWTPRSRALAKANNLSYDAMQQTVTAIREQGIEAGVAQSLVAQFARGQLDMAKSNEAGHASRRTRR